MNKVAVLIAHGPNSVAVPCRIFPSLEQGKGFMVERFGVAKQWDREKKKYVDNPQGWTWPIDNEEDERVTSLFTGYYGGCGGVGALSLKEVDFDSVFVCWDLD